MPGEWQKQPGAVVMQYNRLESQSATIVGQLQGLHTYWANCRPMQPAPGVNFGQVYLSFDKLKQLHLWQNRKTSLFTSVGKCKYKCHDKTFLGGIKKI